MINLKPIGYAHTPYKQQGDAPVQAKHGASESRIVVDSEFREGLADLEGFERIWLVSWLDRSNSFKMKVIPHRETAERGLFSTRSPNRPNPVGLSCVEVISVNVEKGEIIIKSIDLLDKTPILDIKPYIPSIDSFPDSARGWHGRLKDSKSDHR